MLDFRGKWSFWVKTPHSRTFERLGRESIENWDEFWTVFEQVIPVNALEAGSEIAFFKSNKTPFMKPPVDPRNGRWVCHLNDIGDLGLTPRLIWEMLVVELINGEWINRHGEYPVKFLGKIKDDKQYDVIFSMDKINEMMIDDIDGMIIEKRDSNEFILSVWNRLSTFTNNLPSTVPANANDKSFDYEITRYERPFNKKFDMLKQTGMTFANYRRRIFGGVEGTLIKCKQLLMETGVEVPNWDEVDLIFRCRYVFHKRNRRQTVEIVDYPSDGLEVEEIMI